MRTHSDQSRAFQTTLPQLRAVLGGLLALTFPLACWAQDDGLPEWFQVRVIEVERDRVADWEDRAQEISAAVADSEEPAITIFEVLRGDIPTYHVVQPINDIGMFDDPPAPPLEPAAMATWSHRVSEVEASHHVFFAQVYPEYSFQNEGGGAMPGDGPELMMLSIRRNLPGRLPDYETWIGEELVPALREAGITGHTLSRGLIGDSPRNWYHVTPVESWEALETDPLFEALGQEEYAELMTSGGSMIESAENVLLQSRPDLSTPAE